MFKKTKKAKAEVKPVLTPVDADLLADGWYVVPDIAETTTQKYDGIGTYLISRHRQWKVIEVVKSDWTDPFGTPFTTYPDALHAIREEVARRGVERIDGSEIAMNRALNVGGLKPISENWLRD